LVGLCGRTRGYAHKKRAKLVLFSEISKEKVKKVLICVKKVVFLRVI
jgi:hypothetical protein